jgi:Zn2+/Cd2+-exporting ATPase
VNDRGSLDIRVTHEFRETTLAKIVHMVEEAQAKKAPAQKFIDRFSRYYTPSRHNTQQDWWQPFPFFSSDSPP